MCYYIGFCKIFHKFSVSFCSSFLTTMYRHCWLLDTTKGARINTIYTSFNFPTPPPLWGLLPTPIYPVVCLLVSLVELVTIIVLFLYLINRGVYTTTTIKVCTHHPFFKINRRKFFFRFDFYFFRVYIIIIIIIKIWHHFSLYNRPRKEREKKGMSREKERDNLIGKKRKERERWKDRG